MGKVADTWVQKNYLSKGLYPTSTERELLGIIERLEVENNELFNEIRIHTDKLEISDKKLKLVRRKLKELLGVI